MEPLIEELKELWKSVWTIDVVKGRNFILCLVVLWCIHNYPGLSTLCGCVTKAILPVCVATRILSQGDYRKRYVILGIIIFFQLTIQKDSRF
jgi:hypothetical protein